MLRVQNYKNLYIKALSILFNNIRLKKVYNNSFKNRSVLINSFPKSGTHLLYQTFENNIQYINDYKMFLASMPSFTQLERSKRKLINIINTIVNGELVRAHLFYNTEIEDLLVKKKIIHFFIYRDPRDVAISEANYLFDMNKWHRLHKYFKKYPSSVDRIMFSIKGNSFYKTPVDYPNIVERFNKYQGWLSSDHVYCIKYENLIGEKQNEEIIKIMNYYTKQCCEKADVNVLVQKAISNIDPNKSHTFREGGTQKWKKYFNDEHKVAFKEIGGKLLIDLGYEKDLNW